MRDFVSGIAGSIHDSGQKLWCNMGDSRKASGYASWIALDAMSDRPDVVKEEGAFVIKWGKGDAQFYYETDWRRQVDILQNVKNYRVAFHSHTDLKIGERGVDSQGSPTAFEDVLWYSLCSFLLGRNENAYFFFKKPGLFDSSSHEAGAVALLRPAGILLFYNALNGGDPTVPPKAWSLGQALIDRRDLTTVLHRLDHPFLKPGLEWELKGFTDAAVVANGLVPFKGEWLLYYGGADRHIGLATCPDAAAKRGPK